MMNKKSDLIQRVYAMLPEHQRTYTGKALYAAARRIVINNRRHRLCGSSRTAGVQWWRKYARRAQS